MSFICIEGIDAAGKATQSRLLAERLGAELFSFPDYEQPAGHLILGHLKGYWEAAPSADGVYKMGVVAAEDGRPISLADTKALNAFVFQALQLTNRMEHATRISRLLAQGADVVADRYWPSGWAYGQADGLDGGWLERIQGYLPQPDLYLLLDVDPAHSVERRPDRRDRYEEQPGLQARVAFLYRRLWRERQRGEGGLRWVVIDGRKSIENVSQQIEEAVAAARRPVRRDVVCGECGGSFPTIGAPGTLCPRCGGFCEPEAVVR